jgi:transposase
MPATTATPFFSTPMAARLTDEQWERLRPLMPPQKPPTGRPRRDHRTVLAGMLWIFGNGASWRDLPQEEFGSWRTVYGRYRKWRKEGLWRRIVEALQFGHDVADS